MSENAPDFEALAARAKATWSAGDFGEIARSIEAHAEAFIARRGIRPGMRVLDVACGTGNLAIPAARAGADVTGVDIAPNLLEQARARAEHEGLHVRFEEGNAEAMPYPDAFFDLVVSMYGAMFAPCPERAAAELVRVCRPGGEIAMANWTPEGFIGQMFRVIVAHVPPPPGIPSPLLWGDEATVRQRFGNCVTDLCVERVKVLFEYPFSPAETIEFWRAYYGPTQRAFASLPDDGQQALRRELVDLWERHNCSEAGATSVEAEYLEVIATRA